MSINEIYLLTAFVCSACDGDIAVEELAYVKDQAKDTDIFGDLEVENLLNNYVQQINTEGITFINRFVCDLADSELTEEQQLKVIEIAIKMIEADGKIEYSEVKFFKKLRPALTISDEAILARMPEIEDFLLPDLIVREFEFELASDFSQIDLSLIDSKEA